ncbi:MAG TPA: tagaturonate reductase [Flavisolibacter sp.]|nr:tagaturonate reductase [Flavisolibacter sp.]
MILSRYTAKNISNTAVTVPDEALFELPEKVLQFGTGVLLRGLPDYFIDKANKRGLFNGRIVLVKSTTQGDSSAFEKQDGLYTHCIRGEENDQLVEENIINAAISRVLHAGDEWKEVLACAHNPHLEIIVSNTTEVGIELVNDDIRQYPPKSFPGKLLAFLYERFKAFAGSIQSGMVIVPTEMIPDNGDKLQAVVFELAHLNGLEDSFIEWLERCNRFCNSLVDRIVPGRPDSEMLRQLEDSFGYSDQLMIVSEAHCLWAIEGDEEVKNILSFSQADKGVVIAPNIELYRELKLRLLNGTHTFTCGLAFLSGFETVRQCMDDETLSSYMTELMLEEIATSIPCPVELNVVKDYARDVISRFRNPYLNHQWRGIALQYSSKFRTRCVPLIQTYYERHQAAPEAMALGFAAYLCFTRPVTKTKDQFFGEFNGKLYLLQDDQAELFYRRWTGLKLAALVQEVLQDEQYWGTDLSLLPGFAKAVLKKANLLLAGEVKEAIRAHVNA